MRQTATQEEKAIMLMARNFQKKEWFYAPDFMQPDTPQDCWIGYEASAVLSRLTKSYPMLFNIRKEGKYRFVSMRFDNLKNAKIELPRNLWEIIEYEIRFATNTLPQPA